MCGIAGFVGTGNVKVLEKMTRALAHRGPDGEDFRVDAPVYLGHRRLAIIDVEGGHQPMTTRDGRYCLVYNGEIYNFRELRSELENKGHRFSTDHSDTETLLLGFADAQEKVLDRLNGMWAFVIYDRTEKTLFGARDRFGKKPFYYFHRGTDFAFASELTALLEHPEVCRSVSKLSLQKYFAYGYIPAPRTVIRDVWKLPAGHWFRFDLQTGNLRIQKYWDYQPEPDETKKDPRAIAEELADALEQAVRSRLISDVPLGAFLSGGIDSSAIATFATRAVPDLKTFTIGFEERTFDESRHAQIVAKNLQTSHSIQRLSLEKSKHLLPSLVDRLDEPMGDPSLLPTYLLCQFAREHVTVAISGDGGDELFCGYDPFRALRRANMYAKFVPKPLHIGIRLLASRLPVSHRNISLDFKIKRTLRGLSFSEDLWAPVWMGPLEPKELNELFHEKVNLDEIYSEAIDAWDSCSQPDPVSRTQQFFIKLYLQDCILTKADRASMLNGLEVRCPFLDINLVNLARRIPARWKLYRGQTKWILKQALARVLPASIIKRRKKGFGVPVGRWFKENTLIELSERRQTYARFRANFYDRKLAEHRANLADHRLYLWSGWMLNQWLAR